MMYLLPLSKLNRFFAAAAKEGRLFLPVSDRKGEASFKEWNPDVQYSDELNTLRSAKDFFFPQIQNLAEFKLHGKNIEISDMRSESEDFIVFGVRACDARSFSVLDNVFLSDPVDSCYQNRREHCTLISVACVHPETTCFCGSFGIDAAEPEGDIRCWMTEESLFLESLTEKGQKLVEKLGDLITECNNEKVEAQKAETRDILSRLPLAKLKYENLTDKQLDSFNSPKWAELSQACLGCGVCTFVCPTCQCYDIRDFDTGNGIRRFRCWDSCMYSDFTLMASGNPRLTQLERFRQRFMHKLVYYPMNNGGEAGCVGCGRCLRKCPVAMNIVKVMKALREVDE